MHKTLSYAHVAWAMMPFLCACVLFAFLRLALWRTLLVSALRTLVQLSLIGLVLGWVFAREHWSQTLSFMTIMVLVASFAAKNRVTVAYRGLFWDVLMALCASGFGVGLLGAFLVFEKNWFAPSVAIPIMGLILGNALTAISLSLSSFTNALSDQSDQIRQALLLSATPAEATHALFVQALNQGMTPIINTMMVVGVVSLPGMMTGQILAGVDPTQAVLYQMITFFLMGASCCFGCSIALFLARRRFFDAFGRLVLSYDETI